MGNGEREENVLFLRKKFKIELNMLSKILKPFKALFGIKKNGWKYSTLAL
jgi:hypothetical protein